MPEWRQRIVWAIVSCSFVLVRYKCDSCQKRIRIGCPVRCAAQGLSISLLLPCDTMSNPIPSTSKTAASKNTELLRMSTLISKAVRVRGWWGAKTAPWLQQTYTLQTHAILCSLTISRTL